MKAYYRTNFVEGGLSFEGDALIEEIALNEVVWYFVNVKTSTWTMFFRTHSIYGIINLLLLEKIRTYY